MAAMKRAQTIKRYFDNSVSKTLMTGQLKSMMPSEKRKMQISLAIDNYIIKSENQ
ncbi:MAG: hypothetical protein Q7U10_02355 [Thermodesulfovibrionia bacterium]|nr:hypothetical protein [Thermodesulfovibrionia bacterium]